jgi:outer membrane usher protein FimD/PapC
VKDPDGKVANWNLELASPNMMQRNGWTRHSLKEGEEVVVTASRAKDGTNTASADTITKTDGTKLTFMAAPNGPIPTK